LLVNFIQEVKNEVFDNWSWCYICSGIGWNYRNMVNYLLS